MATTTPFTYNNGTYIQGTEQIGDLSIGLLSQDYSNNPGGKTWWMGPDEDNIYVIGKDVPTEDHPTPLGNIGSVEFWATSTRSDSEFISLTNNIGGQSFTTTTECLNWLSTNGFWTNYTELNFGTFTTQSSWIMKQNNGGPDQVTGYGNIFTPNDDIYISSVMNRGGNFTPFLPYRISSSDFPSSGETTFNTPYTNNIYMYPKAIPGGTNFGYGYLSHNTSSNYLFATYGTFDGSSGITGGIAKWNLNNNTLIDSRPYGDFSPYLSQDVMQTWCPANDKVYAVGGFDGSNKLQIYSGSDFTADFEEISTPGNARGRIYSSTDNSGKILWINGGGSSSRWYIISGSAFTHTGNNTPSMTNSFLKSGGFQAAYSKTSQKFYALGIKSTNGNTVETAYLLVVDPFNLTDKVIEFGNTDTLNQNTGGSCVWDSNRNCIWTFDVEGKLFAFECENDEIVKSDIIVQGIVSTSNNQEYMMTIDTTGDLLILANNTVYNLNSIWPI